MKQVFRLDPILMLLWTAASEHACDGDLSRETSPAVAPRLGARRVARRTDPQWEPVPGGRQASYFGVVTDNTDMRPRFNSLRYTSSARVHVAPSHIANDLQAPEALNDLRASASRQPAYLDMGLARDVIAETGVLLFGCTEHTHNAHPQNDNDVIGADDLET